MDFEFTDDQVSLRDAVARWVEKGYGFEHRRATVRAGGFSAASWAALAELGLLGLALPEEHGGMAFGAVEAMVVMEELGRGMVLEPYAAVALVAAPMLVGSAAPSAPLWLAGVADGSALIVLAHQERAARYRLNHVQTTARQDSAGNWLISGSKSLVPAGEHAGAFIVPARVSGAADDESGIALFIVSKGAGVTVRGYPTQDGACAAEVAFDQAAGIEMFPAGPAFEVLQAAIDRALAAQAAEAVGLMNSLTAITVDYMNTRKQFNTPLSGFQALRHRIADVKMQLELARSMSYYASLKLGEPPAQRRRAISQAKVQIGNSARFVGQQCVQLHGGIGVTDEYVASHYFKRLTMLEMQYGDTLHHLGEVSAAMQDSAGVFA
ncbi:acyl-CoA dehydrogenase family protein [Ideonella sp.]|uniref:acyl-CoA dehydrogenase family protein n=1 Tax=Ideonella sp. TaxID=1929293 RepID=UPI003BB4B75F